VFTKCVTEIQYIKTWFAVTFYFSKKIFDVKFLSGLYLSCLWYFGILKHVKLHSITLYNITWTNISRGENKSAIE